MSNAIDILNQSNFYLYRYIGPILFIVGNIGNFLSIFIFLKKSWRKNVCVFYMQVCLIFDSCYNNSYIIGSIFIYGYGINVQDSNVIICKLFFYVGFYFSVAVPMFLILASIDRLLISSQNIDTRLYSSKRLAYLLCSINSIVWLIFFVHILIRVNLEEYSPSFRMCYFDPTESYLDFISYSSLVLTSIFSITMIVLIVLAFKNVRHIRLAPRQSRREVRQMTKKDFQLLRCLFALDISFIFFTIFLNMFYVYSAVTKAKLKTDLELAIGNFVFAVLNFIHHIPFCSNIFVFIFVSRAFRNELKRFINKIICKNIVQKRPEEENLQ